MDRRELDRRQIAIVVSRARCVLGLTSLVLPSVVARVVFGTSAPAARAATRFVGIRDLVLGVGALTNLKERNQDAEWLSMGAVSDAVDGIVSLTQRGLPARARLIGAGALGTGALLLQLSRDLAAERKHRVVLTANG